MKIKVEIDNQEQILELISLLPEFRTNDTHIQVSQIIKHMTE